MKSNEIRKTRRLRRKRGIRKRIHGTREYPRLSVFRSAKHIYAQIIDDDQGVTLAEASSVSKALRGQLAGGGNVAAAKTVGAALAEQAKSKGVEQVRFDRNGYRFHGRLKALAEAVREAGVRC
jgi:large subunit ribosomal protein L18